MNKPDGGIGDVPLSYHRINSGPTLVPGVVVVSGNVADGQHMGEPSGVIRAYDAVTGRLAQAWDAGRPDRTGEPPSGETYTAGTPNSWPPLSADEVLGLVYVPLGNPTAGLLRKAAPPVHEKFGSAIVALDATSGKLHWSFNTIHHDLWGFDIVSQPSLADFPVRGRMVKGLIQPTKRAETFVLDRETRKPIYPVVERPAFALPMR